jgi:predicted DNA-binding protein with PD1-like motif
MGGLKFILKDRKAFVFVVITEVSVANQKGVEALSVTGIGNAVTARWRFVATADNKTLKPPLP